MTRVVYQPKWLRDMLEELKKSHPSENQPRVPAGVPEGGQFGEGGGGGGGGSSGGGGPRPRVEAKESTVSAETTRKIRTAMDAIPAAHAEKIKDIPISIFKSNDSPGFSAQTGAKIGAAGAFRYEEGGKAIGIVLAESKAYSYNEYEGNKLVGTKVDHAALGELEKVAIHEVGHALDFQEGNGWGHSSSTAYKNDFFSGWKRMSEKEKRAARHYFVNSRESFAELYAFLHNPVKSDTYLGGMKRSRVEKLFPEALVRVRAI